MRFLLDNSEKLYLKLSTVNSNWTIALFLFIQLVGKTIIVPVPKIHSLLLNL